MYQITVAVDGMQCGMCEAHINDAIRRQFKVKKVKSSRRKKQTLIVSETDIPDEEITKVIADTGYEPGAVHREVK